MYESDYNRFDPESQFMLTCPGSRLPVSTGSPPGDCLQERSEAAPPDPTERSDRDNDLTYKLVQAKRIPLQDSTASSGNFRPPSVLKFTQRENGVRKYRAGLPGIPRAISWRETLPSENVPIQVRCSYRDTGDLRPPGSNQCTQSVDTSLMRKTQPFMDRTGTRKSDTYFTFKTILTYPAKQSRHVFPTLSPCFPPGRDVRRIGNLYFPPGKS
jgi:hypothetical protein